MYNTCITCTPNIGLQNVGKKFLCIIQADFLEFVSAKFNLKLTVVQLFASSYWLKIRIYIVYIMS